jgi:hypothetical protein|tara:strand:+ start:187958 stop:188767 length:810 start_codon:yes stop_codon:yes gene_type:complete
MNYENRIVLFLDILGFKNIIEKTIDKEEDIEKNISSLYSNLKYIKTFLIERLKSESMFNERNYSLKVTQFSDSVIISFINDDNTTLLNLIRSIQELIIKLTNEGILCRGAISYGKLIHDNRVIFGPALNDAYETETKAAIYPRVILDKSLIELGKKRQKELFETEGINTEDLIYGYLSHDSDDKFYIDYFPKDIWSYKYITKIEPYLSNLRQIIIYGLRNKKPDLKSKYGWMKNKYNKMLTDLKSEGKIYEISQEKGLFEYIDKIELLN